LLLSNAQSLAAFGVIVTQTSGQHMSSPLPAGLRSWAGGTPV